MRRFRSLITYPIVVPVLVAVALLRLDLGVSAQVEPLSVTPPLIEEVSRLVREHFYDRDTVERVWAQARAAHTAALPADATSEEVAATLDAMLDELGASHTEHYTPGELAYYELLDIFTRDEFAPRLRNLFPQGRVAYTGIGVVPRMLEGRVFLAAVYHGGPAERAGLLVGDEIVAADGKPILSARSTKRASRSGSRSGASRPARHSRWRWCPGASGRTSSFSARCGPACASSSAKVGAGATSGSGPMHAASTTIFSWRSWQRAG
jgi:hypothetical protein